MSSFDLFRGIKTYNLHFVPYSETVRDYFRTGIDISLHPVSYMSAGLVKLSKLSDERHPRVVYGKDEAYAKIYYNPRSTNQSKDSTLKKAYVSMISKEREIENKKALIEANRTFLGKVGSKTWNGLWDFFFG